MLVIVKAKGKYSAEYRLIRDSSMIDFLKWCEESYNCQKHIILIPWSLYPALRNKMVLTFLCLGVLIGVPLLKLRLLTSKVP